MATALHNLSEYDPNVLPDATFLERQHYGIVVADWNQQVTFALLEGAVNTLESVGVPSTHIHITHVPGTVELTYAAQKMAAKQPMDAIIVIGCVIQGDTPHFDYVCQSVTQGVAILNAQGNVPVIFSVLTTNDLQQALDRAGGKLGNKGTEGAYTAIQMANLHI